MTSLVTFFYSLVPSLPAFYFRHQALQFSQNLRRLKKTITNQGKKFLEQFWWFHHIVMNKMCDEAFFWTWSYAVTSHHLHTGLLLTAINHRRIKKSRWEILKNLNTYYYKGHDHLSLNEHIIEEKFKKFQKPCKKFFGPIQNQNVFNFLYYVDYRLRWSGA